MSPSLGEILVRVGACPEFRPQFRKTNAFHREDERWLHYILGNWEEEEEEGVFLGISAKGLLGYSTGRLHASGKFFFLPHLSFLSFFLLSVDKVA